MVELTLTTRDRAGPPRPSYITKDNNNKLLLLIFN